MRIRVLISRRTGSVVRVIHARAEVRVKMIDILMSKAERMADFLTHHELLKRRRVVRSTLEIGVIHFRSRHRDVAAAVAPHLGNARPSGESVIAVADFHLSGIRIARTRRDGHRCCVKHVHRIPVRD